MMTCCIDLSIAARMIGLYGLVVGAIVMVEMSSEVGRVQCAIESTKAVIKGQQVLIHGEELSGGAALSAWLLGLSLNEFGSRMRHSMHAGGELPPHLHINPTAKVQMQLLPGKEQSLTEVPKRNQTQDLYAMEAEHQIYVGFLLFAIVYASSSALLVFGSVSETPWTCVPWLVAHLGTVSAQTAGLIVQVSAAIITIPEDDHLAPGHPDAAHQPSDDHRGSSAPGALILSTLNMLFLVCTWIIVIVAMRSWIKPNNLVMSTRPAKGDETYALSMSGASTDYSISYF